MSFKKNAYMNFVSQFYSLFIYFLIFPTYLKYLGPIVFGLIGFLMLMQSWFKLFDLGLSSAFSRVLAYNYGANKTHTETQYLLKSMEIIFLVTSIVIMSCVFLGKHWLAHRWLKIGIMNPVEVEYCIALMGVIVSVNFFSGLYYSGIEGTEHQVWLGFNSVMMVTLQYVGGWVLLRWFNRSPSVFFEYQVIISFLKLIVLRAVLWKILSTSKIPYWYFSWEKIKVLLPFSCNIMCTALMWIAITQTDKLILSHILSLNEYGYFILATTLASGLIQIAMPIYQALLPRMTNLLAQNKHSELFALYKHATKIIVVLVMSITGVIMLFPQEVLYIWTNNSSAAYWGSTILFWGIMANCFLTINAFPYYLQMAHGNLKLHLWYTTLYTVVLIPILDYAAIHYGAVGVVIALCFSRFFSFAIWVPFIHHRFATGIHGAWLKKDIMPVFLTTLIVLFFAKHIPLHFHSHSRAEEISYLIGIGFLLLVCNTFSSGLYRQIFQLTEKNIKNANL